MKIYIAGKITGEDEHDVKVKFGLARNKLLTEGHEVFIPTVLPIYNTVEHADYMHICFAMIDICDAVYMLNDWTQSAGAREEMQYAQDWKKQIIFEGEKEDEERNK